MPNCRRAPCAGAAGWPPKLRRHRRSCRTSPAAIKAARPPPKLRRQSSSSGSVVRELNCRRSFQAAQAGVLWELKSLAGVALRQSGSPAAQLREYIPFLSMSPPLDCRQSFSGSPAERDCTPGAELPPSSPCRSCSSAGPKKILAML